MTSDYWTLHEAPADSPKKWAVRVPTASGRGKVVLFGARGYEDFTTHHDVDRRERYRTRHQRDRLDDPYAPGFWSMWALWGESDDLDTAFADAVKRAKKILKQLGEPVMPRHNPDPDRVAFSIIMGPAKGMKQRIIDFALRLSDVEVERVSTTFSRQGPAIWRYWSKAMNERKKAGKGVPSWARENPVREQFNFTHYEEYAAGLSDAALHHAIIDALDALKVAKTWDDGGAGEAKYLDQLSVLRREQKARGMRNNPRPLREDWLEEAREAGRNDAINFGDGLAERRDYLVQAGWRTLDDEDRALLLKAWDEGAREVRHNPEWAKKIGRGIYRGARYTAESARDLYHGAREAHESHKRRQRENPSVRLPGIGKLSITPDPQGGRDDAVVDVTRAFASEWDHDMLNHAYLSRSVMEAVEEHREGSNFYAVTLCFQGREFAKLYP